MHALLNLIEDAIKSVVEDGERILSYGHRAKGAETVRGKGGGSRVEVAFPPVLAHSAQSPSGALEG